jgi:hypothetical protein
MKKTARCFFMPTTNPNRTNKTKSSRCIFGKQLIKVGLKAVKVFLGFYIIAYGQQTTARGWALILGLSFHLSPSLKLW